MIKPFFAVITSFFLFFLIGFFSQPAFASSSPPTSMVRTLAARPGRVANVFGWGYNRASCHLEGTNDDLVFFYQEDAHIYYFYTSDPDKYYLLSHERTQNPDFDIYCEKDKVFISYSDPNQSLLYLAEGRIENNIFSLLKEEHVYTGPRNYSAVAPHTRIFKGIPYIVFMEYGVKGSEYPFSKVYVVSKEGNHWKTTHLFTSPEEGVQVMGISLEKYQNTLLAFVSPPSGVLVVTWFDPKTQKWSTPKEQPVLTTRGHLEWLSHLDKEGVFHMIFRNYRQSLAYAQLRDGQWHVEEFGATLALNAFSMTEVEGKGVFVLSNTGTMRKVIGTGLSKPVELAITSVGEMYFLRLPAISSTQLHPIWLTGPDNGHFIKKTTINLEDWLPQMNELDTETYSTVTEQLVKADLERHQVSPQAPVCALLEWLFRDFPHQNERTLSCSLQI